MEAVVKNITNRRAENSTKWNLYPEDVIPLWIADMDFMSAEPILQAMQDRLNHGIFGYEEASPLLLETIAKRMKQLFDWTVSPEYIVETPGTLHGVITAAETCCSPGNAFMLHTPAYPPFLKFIDKNKDMVCQRAPLKCSISGQDLTYEMDWEVMESVVHSGGVQTDMFLLCSPQNPTGRVFSKEELLRFADFCIKKNLFICSDEIYCELTLDSTKHHPIASLSAEIADRTISMFSASKNYNLAGLYTSFAIIPNKKLRDQFRQLDVKRALHANNMGLAAAQAVYSGSCDAWSKQIRAYLKDNRDFLINFVKTHLPDVRITTPHATFLAWMDFRELMKKGIINENVKQFFLREAKVGLYDGLDFGATEQGFTRLNFACHRSVLEDALNRMKDAIRD